jgi:hypothetical protein
LLLASLEIPAAVIATSAAHMEQLRLLGEKQTGSKK